MSIATQIINNNCLPFPKILQLEITDRCPFNCAQCYRLSLADKDADINRLKSLISYAKDRGTTQIVLNGGEPLLYKHIEELLVFLSQTNIYVNCFSSGYGLTDEIIKYLHNPFFNYCVSLNGSNKAINDLSRCGFEYAVSAMSILKSNDIPFGIHWVARHDNILDLPNLLSLLENKGATFISIGSNKLTHKREIDSPLSDDDFKELVGLIRNYFGPIKIFIENCFPELSWHLGLGLKSRFSGCGAGRTMCHITTDFRYAPCTHLHYYEEYPSIEEYWTNSHILESIRKRNVHDTSSCCNCELINNCKMCFAASNESYNNPNAGILGCKVNSIKAGD
jgi:pyrroloquinoline quinone biosynthesis protein E